MSKKILIVIMTIAFMAMSTFSFAATIKVPADQATIAAAIAAAGAGDVISIAGGSYAEDITVNKRLTIMCSSLDSMATITGAAGAGDAVTITAAASGTSTTVPTLFQNVVVDISANAAKVAGDACVTAATLTNYLKFYNCTFKGRVAAPVTTDIIEVAGAAIGWQIENCTFTFGLAGTISNALSFKGAAAVADFNILGNTFTGAGNGTIATDARAVNVVNTVASFTGFYYGGNTATKAGLVLNYGTTASGTGLPVYANVRIYDNVFAQSLAFTMIGPGAADTGAACWSTGQLLIKGNKFGSLSTEGDSYYAIMFDKFVTADFTESNVFINNNNFQYPMTNGVDVLTFGGHVTANWTSGTLTAIDATNNYWGQITGPLTAYESKGIAVVKTAGTPFSYIPYINTYSIPQVDETNHGITIFDFDGNGKIDRAVVWFDQYLDPSTISYSGWAIAGGYTFKTDLAPKLSIDNDHEGTPDGVFALTLFINEGATYDTGVTPDITYTKSTGTLTGITGNSNAKVNDILSATATEHDKALPIMVSAVSGDATNNGKLDAMVVTFSEAVALASPTATPITDAMWAANVVIAGVVGTTGGTVSNNVVTFAITEGALNTGLTTTVTYTKAANNNISDVVGNLMLNSVKATTDGAAPVATKVETGDGNADGYIDQFKITFSENIAATAVADTAKIRTAFTAAKVENTLDFTTASVATAAATITITGRSLKDASSIGHPWDTDAKPEVKYANAGGIKDAAGIAWVYFWDTTAAKAVTTYPTTEVVDSARPIIARATGQVNSKNLYVTFSEPSVEAAGGNLITGDFTYYNVYNTGLNATAIAAMGADADASDANATVTLTMDEVFLVNDVVNDSLSVATVASVKDMAAVANFVNPVVKVTINDVIAPTLLSAITQDVDNDGWIDTIKLTFSEAINDAGITGYNGTDKISLNAATNWLVNNYTVEGLNFVSDATEQTTATTDAVARNLTGVFNELGKVINVGDVANDNILYLAVAETSGLNDQSSGDTNATPALTVTGGTAAAVGDFKPNYLETVTKTPADKAGAALMDAKFITDKKLRVWLSEAVSDTLIRVSSGNITLTGTELQSSDFTLKVGNFGNTVGTAAKDVTQISDGVVDLVWIDPITTANAAGWIGINAASINDKAGNANTQNIGLANNVGYKTITAWDGSVEPGINGRIAAPTGFTITDIAADNGHWFLAKFTASTNVDVKSYQFYRGVIGIGDEPTDTVWVYTAVVPKGYVGEYNVFNCYVPTPVNGTTLWAVVASTGTEVSPLAMKEGEIPVASLVPAGKVTTGVEVSALSNIVVGGAIDNIAPSALTVYAADDNPGAASGIRVTWTSPADYGIVGTYGNGTYQFPIYGVNAYEVYRKEASDATFTLVGTAPAGSTEFVDHVADGATVYTYMIKATDGTYTVQTGTKEAMANANINIADFNSDGKVDFTDFTMFASAYGTTPASANWISLFDLVDNGSNPTIDFEDFTSFAANYNFGVAKAAKEIAGVQLPVSDVSFTMDSKIDEATSMYYINVNVSDFAKLNGFQFNLAYDSSALELVKDSISGLNGLTIQNDKDGVIDIANMFNGEQFNGTVTLGFQSKGVNSNFVFELTNALVSDKEFGISQVTKLSKITAKALPTVYSLSKNYPNPFNPTTTIEYAIPSNGKVELVVYNMTGQKIRTLINENKEAGFFKAVWDGRNDRGETVASGLYFYKLVSGKFNKIEKMTLVK